MKTFGDTPYDPEKNYVVVTVANVGRRAVTVTTVGFAQKSKGAGDIVLSDSMQPREVAEGKAVHYLAEQDHLPLGNLSRVLVRDQAGRLWTHRVPASVRRSTVTPTLS
jgi:hypothetical protein